MNPNPVRLTLLFVVVLVLAGCETPSSTSSARTTPSPRDPKIPPDVVRITDLQRIGVMPVPLTQTEPVYPPSLVKKNIQGVVVVQFIISTDGNVYDAAVVRAPDKLLGEAAVQAVLQWKFRPGMVNGQPVNSLVEVPITFSLSDK